MSAPRPMKLVRSPYAVGLALLGISLNDVRGVGALDGA